MEEWRKKAIAYLEKSEDPDMWLAVKVLREGTGYLCSEMPVRIESYRDMKPCITE